MAETELECRKIVDGIATISKKQQDIEQNRKKEKRRHKIWFVQFGHMVYFLPETTGEKSAYKMV